ncbi:MAG: ATP F0F1 synthase subunit alpha [Gammaproteobacteria bacterium SG8_11]|nr:MAG: ATP F0F1 synthase subunit alpha [Gammaproteobacteria bacterium SG8_11]
MDQSEDPPMDSLLERQSKWLADYSPGLRVYEQGIVVSVGDGITWINGLPSAAMDDVLDFEDGSQAIVFALTKQMVGAVLLHQTERLTAGTIVYLTGKALSIPVGDEMLGRVVDPAGFPLDGPKNPECKNRQNLDSLSPPFITREFVREPLYTGNKIIDTLIPIGKGQRQLIVGDKGLGRSSLAIDAVINQRDKNVYCVYVLIGQKRSTVINVIQTLKEYDALQYTAIVAGEASALPGLKYLAPFAGCAIAEAWMHQGRDTLVIYDDLSMHAQTYRELSLLLRRPPGREAYPGDIFYLHARLLERATCLSHEYGGGSMTALPIVETRQGEIASYIPTNLISITDGQIYLDADLFAGGFFPAIDIAKSVSRIGGKAQHQRIKDEAGRMKLDYLQYLELEAFTRFGAKLEVTMETKIKRGRLLREILTQDRLSPLAIEFNMAWLIAFNEGLLDDLKPEQIDEALEQLNSSVADSPLTLDDERTRWVNAVRAWLPQPSDTQDDTQT